MTDWWRTAVIYQIYPRSFADADGNGIGDLPGITARLEALQELGVDAVWLSPFFVSPQRDAGYDVADYRDVDPLFGTLADFDALLVRAHELGLRVLVDLVPNHSSSDHPWFQAALAAPKGSPDRARYIFREGDGDAPPNNWKSVFGGSMWERIDDGSWYLHIFDVTQPDFDWTNPEVRAMFEGVLRFWLDRGVDGFRIDVAHGLVKKHGLPDWTELAVPPARTSDVPYWAQPGVHEIYRDWRRILESYPGDRALVGEAWVEPLTDLADWVRPDELQQTFNFRFIETAWDAAALKQVVDDSLEAFGAVGAPSTWVLSNHDMIRHATRFGLDPVPPQGVGVGPKSASVLDAAAGLRRARAATLFMLALPGSAYLYQGEELGLPEVIDIPDADRQDPSFVRSHGAVYGRDGCRVPIPWTSDQPAQGFNRTGASWLPQPAGWGAFARDAQRGASGPTLELYKLALRLRAEHALGGGELRWLPSPDPEVLVFRTRDLTVAANTGSSPVRMPEGAVLAASGPLGDASMLPADTTVWLGA